MKNKRTFLLARLKAQQKIRRVKQKIQQVKNATNSQNTGTAQPPSNIAAGQPVDNGATEQPERDLGI